MMRFFLDHKLRVTMQWHMRNGGGLLIGVRVTFPMLVMEEDGGHWWRESLSIGLGPCSLKFDWCDRIIPWAPGHLFEPPLWEQVHERRLPTFLAACEGKDSRTAPLSVPGEIGPP